MPLKPDTFAEEPQQAAKRSGKAPAPTKPGDWKKTFPGRITAEDAENDPDPLFPSE